MWLSFCPGQHYKALCPTSCTATPQSSIKHSPAPTYRIPVAHHTVALHAVGRYGRQKRGMHLAPVHPTGSLTCNNPDQVLIICLSTGQPEKRTFLLLSARPAKENRGLEDVCLVCKGLLNDNVTRTHTNKIK